MERIRMGVIGCGEIAQIMHLPFLTELNDLYEVRAVCERMGYKTYALGKVESSNNPNQEAEVVY